MNNTSLEIACDLIKKFEGLRLEAYICPAGVWTIGYGTTTDVKQGQKITKEEAEKLLLDDIFVFHSCVVAQVGSICNQKQIAALTSFCYNVGKTAFLKSTLLERIKQNPNNFETIKAEFMRWIHGGVCVLTGLAKRREEEFLVYCM